MTIELFNADCLEIMPKLKANSVDMVLADLPYGTTRNKWDSVIPLDRLWGGYKRIVKPNGAIVLFSAEPFTSELVMSNPGMFRYDLIWSKDQGTDFLNANRKPLKSHENILVFYQKQPKYIKQITKGKPYKAISGKQSSNWGEFKEGFCTDNDGYRNPLSVLSFKSEHGEHPTQKPVPLLSWLIRSYTDEGDTILDNTMGSGSTGVACVRTNRDFIGIELNQKYFETAKRRIEKAMCQDALFYDLPNE